jgi:hypothetical protein
MVFATRPRIQPDLSPACEKAQLLEPDIVRALAAKGLRLRVGRPAGGRARHWMVEGPEGRRVVDYWPSTGRWWCQQDGRRGRLEFVWEVVALAAQLAYDSCRSPRIVPRGE